MEAARRREIGRLEPLGSKYPGALGAALGFSALYTLQLREFHATQGQYGPLSIFEPERRVLFLAYCGRPPAFPPSLPLSWSRNTQARFLYSVYGDLDLLQHKVRQFRARHTLERMLRLLQMPPGRLPPIGVSQQAFGLLHSTLRAAVYAAREGTRCPSIRRHLQDASIKSLGVKRWASSVNANRLGRSFSTKEYLQLPMSLRSQAFAHADLHKLEGIWRLPR